MENRPDQKSLGTLTRLFLKLGIIGFGGPAAHIAMMEDEVVSRRGWMERSQFLDLVGATNLIPGPNSTEMAIHIGYIYGGLAGLVLAGVSFIVPAVLITAFLAYLYQSFGSLPEISPLLGGIKPVVVAIIAQAVWKLAEKAVKNRSLLLIGFGVGIAVLGGMNELLALLLGGGLGMIWLGSRSSSALWLGLITLSSATIPQPVSPNLVQLGLFFLKVGSVLFGSGYVLVAFLQGELVDTYQWLSQAQLLDAIAIGQLTPGPVLSTATFIGYLILGIPGAIVATIGIFLPSFFWVLLLNPLIPRLRQSKRAGAFLDAVNVSAVALMGVVTYQLAQETFLAPFNPLGALLMLLSMLLLIRYRVNAAWLLLGGAVLGFLAKI
jgi:chromate transporter